jgi:hypothetical protein
MHSAAAIAFTTSLRTRNVATNRNGSVVMSPSAVTIGVPTASRSHPRRYETSDSPTVISRMKIEPSAPPTTEIVTKSQIEIVARGSTMVEAIRASAASHSDDVSVVIHATSTFCCSTPP